MRKWMSAVMAGAAVTMLALPAQAAWKNYVNKEIGFAFAAPGDVKADVGNFRGSMSGPRQTILYKSAENGIDYRITVISYPQAQAEGATLLGEREYMFTDKRKVISDNFSRVGSGKDAVYGRKIVVELDNKNRITGAFYFTKGRLIMMEAIVPANGNHTSPDPGRFVDSIAFTVRAEPGAVELETPRLE